MIGGDLPVWVNEGIAEYFGKAQISPAMDSSAV